MAKHNSHEDSRVDIETLKKAILNLESPKAKRDRERAALFSDLYEPIRDKLNAGVAKNVLVKMLADHKPISVVQFDELLLAEAKRRCEPVPGKDNASHSQAASADCSAQMLDAKEGK
ncbi:hypothetical protein [Ralstonia pseudosolanacearum]|uniref:hypothetical protein n=1 Tax=Ralstonia pseudosolanacearum TaxID=1310165 RepID=UPI003865F283